MLSAYSMRQGLTWFPTNSQLLGDLCKVWASHKHNSSFFLSSAKTSSIVKDAPYCVTNKKTHHEINSRKTVCPMGCSDIYLTGGDLERTCYQDQTGRVYWLIFWWRIWGSFLGETVDVRTGKWEGTLELMQRPRRAGQLWGRLALWHDWHSALFAMDHQSSDLRAEALTRDQCVSGIVCTFEFYWIMETHRWQ